MGISFGLSFQGADQDRFYHGIEVSGGGFLFVGRTRSYHPTGSSGLEIPVVRTDASGGIVWQYVFGHPNTSFGTVDRAYEVREVLGEYLVVGRADVNDPLSSVGDMMVMRLDASGNLVWGITIGGNYCDDYGTSLEVLGSQVYVTGTFRCWGPTNSYYIPLVNLDLTGNLQWARVYGGPGMDWANHVSRLSDGNLLIVGFTYSFGSGGRDVILIKVNPADGTVVWAKVYGSAADEEAKWFVELPDGSLAVVGTASGEAMFMRVDQMGNLITAKRFDIGPLQSEANSVELVGSNLVVVGGYGGAFVLEVDINGNLLNAIGFASGLGDWFETVEATSDGGVILSGVWGTSAQDALALKGHLSLSVYDCPPYRVTLTPTVTTLALNEVDITPVIHFSDVTPQATSNLQVYTPARTASSFVGVTICPLYSEGMSSNERPTISPTTRGSSYDLSGRKSKPGRFMKGSVVVR